MFFSSENWKRPKKEINYLFKLIKTYFSKEIESIIKQGIKINIIGELNKLSSDIKLTLKQTVNLTKSNKKILVNLAINYGSKNEILQASKKIGKNFNIKNFSQSLYTKNMPDPDVLIRTGGHQRISNFLLWQLAYSELYFLKKLWPDFNSNDLKKIISNFKNKKEFWRYMIPKNLKERIFTSLFLFFLLSLVIFFDFIMIYSLIVLGTLSLIEFLNLSKKILKIL